MGKQFIERNDKITKTGKIKWKNYILQMANFHKMAKEKLP